MPNFDGGHYFLTVLAPIDTTRLSERRGVKSSAVHVVRDVLATLPTALQSPATEALGLNSPFSRSRRTHLARFVVIDDVVYNGRDRRDALPVALFGPNPVIAEAEDKLTSPYLLFVADFDARSDNAEELKAYLAELWSVMEAELRLVFGHCVGFDRVTNAASFQDYIVRCQIETTMPFNDYWVTPPPLISLKPLLLRVLAAVAVTAVVLLGVLVASGWSWPGAVLLALGALLGLLIIPYAIVMQHGRKPLPTAPGSDLPSVLKALYLQRNFTGFAIAAQGQDDAAVYDLFGKFIAEHQPTNLQNPTQEPGVIGL